MRPRRLEQRAIAGIAKDFGGEEDELSVAVVLRNGIGAPEVDAAGHLAVFELVRSEPAQIVRRDVGVPEPDEGFRYHRSITDPRASVGARAGAQNRTVARHQDVRERRPQRVNEVLTRGGHVEFDEVELAAPVGLDLPLLLIEPIFSGPARKVRPCRLARKRSHETDRAAFPRRQFHLVDERRRCKSSIVRDAVDRIIAGNEQLVGIAAGFKWRGGKSIWRRERHDLRLAVDRQLCPVPVDGLDGADATREVQELGRRIDLERARGKHELQRLRSVGDDCSSYSAPRARRHRACRAQRT